MFALADVRAEQVMAMRGGHLRCRLVDAGRGEAEAPWPGAPPTRRSAARLLAGGGGLHVAGRLKPDDWNGRQGVQLEIEDLADPRRA